MRYTEQQMNSELLDQPEFAGEPRKIYICSTPRSGSYMLCRYMINAGLGVPHEYFNPVIMRQIAPRLGLGNSVEGLKWRHRSPWDHVPFGTPARARAAEANFLGKYIDAIVARRCQGGIFAAKIHFDQFLKVLDNPVGRSLLDGGLFIHLYRDDLLAQAVSTHFAKLTGLWSIDDAVTTAPAAQPDFFDVAGLGRTLEELAEEDRGWRVFLARNGVSPMAISYERLREDPFGFVAAIARRLGLDPGTLRRGYSEAGAASESARGLPRKSEVARHYLAAVRQIRAAEPTACG
jgi:LPS sulfotransferase NodH